MALTELIQFYFSLFFEKTISWFSQPVNVNLFLMSLGLSISFTLSKIKSSKKNWIKWGTLFYFSIMQFLQAITYFVIEICSHEVSKGKLNELITTLSYLHICFQPIWINLFGLSFSMRSIRLKVWTKRTIIIMSFFSFVMISRMFFHNEIGICNVLKTPLCGLDTCSYKGEWHIAWRIALNSFDELVFGEFKITWTWFFYNIPILIFPFFYGGWRWSLYVLFFGIILSMGLTGNKDEFPSIMGLLSVPLLLVTYIPFIRNWLERPLRKK